ncbi:hypothetical protein KEJ48_02565 [Candidatus Bathyarchaeota archaeon]|nr:hypothetical protein [Candidatus Bathyarchaeota archaeon]MBS7618848.1 hypothetical protein [Candidatus Bathyarchaeota archaeon]
MEEVFKSICSKCLGCPVFEALCVIDPELKSKRKELEGLKRKYGVAKTMKGVCA